MTSLLLLTALVGCDKDSPPPIDSVDTAPVEPVECALAQGIDAAGETIPGWELDLQLLEPAPELQASWQPSSGVLTGEGAQVRWTLDAQLATHVAEVVTVTVQLEAPGCLPETHSLELSVDHPQGHRAVVLYNPEVEGSLDVAQAFAALRDVPEAQLCPVSSDQATTLAGSDYPAWQDTVMACVAAVGEHVHLIVPTYGVPYRVSGRVQDIADASRTTTVSIDALLFFGDRGDDLTQAVYNPLYQVGDSPSGAYSPAISFGVWRAEQAAPNYLVTRIDGADTEQALALVERAALAQQLADAGALSGTVYVDGRYGDEPPTHDDLGSYQYGEWNMWGTRRVFEDAALFPVVWDGNSAEFGTAPAPLECPEALFYAGWYSYNNYNDAFTWAPGAIGGHLDSCSACSVRDGAPWAANALQRGITATFGAVAEPYVVGMPEYDQFFLYLLQGASFAEAAYESTYVGAWMMTWVGDPFYRPFPGGVM